MRPPPPRLTQAILEAWSRATSTTTKNTASKLAKAVKKPAHEQLHTFEHATAGSAPANFTSKARANVGKLVESIWQSTVKSSYTTPHGPYTTSRLPTAASRTGIHPFAFAGGNGNLGRRATPQIRSGVNRTGNRFGPTPRPFIPSHSVGLSSARTFSSGTHSVFANVIANAPLGLRALGNEGLDERKWNRVKKEIKRAHKIDLKGKGKLELGGERLRSKRAEFSTYFTKKVEEGGAVREEASSSAASNHVSVVLYVSVEPRINFTATGSTSNPFDSKVDEFSASYRILPSGSISTFERVTEAYTDHAHKIRAMTNALTRAGVFDDPRTTVEAVSYWDEQQGREMREVRIGFSPNWSLEDVRCAVGTREADPKDFHTWWWLKDLRAEPTQENSAENKILFDALEFSSTASEEIHEINSIANLILPKINHADTNFNSVSSREISLAESISCTPPFSVSLDSEQSQIWSEPDVERESSLRVLEANLGSEYEFDSVWSDHHSAGLSDSYQDGVRGFLAEIERAR